MHPCFAPLSIYTLIFNLSFWLKDEWDSFEGGAPGESSTILWSTIGGNWKFIIIICRIHKSIFCQHMNLLLMAHWFNIVLLMSPTEKLCMVHFTSFQEPVRFVSLSYLIKHLSFSSLHKRRSLLLNFFALNTPSRIYKNVY